MRISLASWIFAAGIFAPVLPVLAQNSQLGFEVASVKYLASPSNSHSSHGGPGTDDPERISIMNISLGGLIAGAYGVRNFQVSGPSWLDAEFYDVAAKVPTGTTREQARIMMQNLLAERFHLMLHHESRMFPAYELRVGKGGARFAASAAEHSRVPGQTLRTVDNPVEATFRASPMVAIASWIGLQLRAPVFDATDLTGVYDLKIEYSIPSPRGAGASDPDSPFLTPLQEALESQLGLSLRAGKRELDVLVVDHAEKMPTAN